ncbi:MAG: bifunctional demethylmenaquinone methyltransferase/2-methoxy-6-polyprenyl-1,4-benzoquinol methylase UbiE [Bacteroidetes bacterium]|nr:bifunctional demethylmenaquinone methyltransferase/2-methoxy-6-polyprenyl-1,4-benzoquinol methylase UbiE [Bacteroidota bacterium]
MFNSIANRYDFLNHFLSMNIDYLWRKKVISILKPYHPESILDVATGTADLAIQATTLKPNQIIGIDISEEMLKIGQEKIVDKNKDSIIQLVNADAENIPFENDCFDACMVAFGVRNFEDLKQGLTEMHRVLKPNGKVVILEFSKPTQFPIKQLYGFYFKRILPFVGKLVSKNNNAYMYLPDSVSKFPERENFIILLKEIGFKELQVNLLTFGIASIYSGTK